jgi:hypothetical protein
MGWSVHHYLSEHGCYSVWGFSHVTIMMLKVDPRAERGAGILIKVISIKVIDARKSLIDITSTLCVHVAC